MGKGTDNETTPRKRERRKRNAASESEENNGEKKSLIFFAKRGRDEEEKRKAEKLFSLSAQMLEKVALSILFFNSFFLVNFFATFDPVFVNS